MCQHVHLEVRSPCAVVFTLLAAERPHSSMNKQMLVHIRSRRRRVGTHLAAMGLLSPSLLGRLVGGHCSLFAASSADLLKRTVCSLEQGSWMTEGKF